METLFPGVDEQMERLDFHFSGKMLSTKTMETTFPQKWKTPFPCT